MSKIKLWHANRTAALMRKHQQIDLPQLGLSTKNTALGLLPTSKAWPKTNFGKASGFNLLGIPIYNKNLPKERVKPVAAHEEMHALFDKVEESLGKEVSKHITYDLCDKISPFVTKILTKALIEEFGYDPSSDSFREELICYCHTYLTDPLNKARIDKTIESKTEQKLFKEEVERSWSKIVNKVTAISEADLKKAVHPDDWKRIDKSHSQDNSLFVDHKPHLEKYPAPKEFTDILNSPETNKALKKMNNGISAKMIHKTPDGKIFMSKPYHKKIESATRSWVKKPILGWASMATKGLFDAAGIGHLCEKVSTHEHNGIPVTVHEFEPHTQEVINLSRNFNPQKHVFNIDDVKKIGIMDFLTNNNDRHLGNLVYGRKDESGTNPLIAIDHERNFQYHSNKRDLDMGLNSYWKKETPMAYIGSSALRSAAFHTNENQANTHDHSDLASWWMNNSSNVKSAMEEHLKHIKDTDTQDHIRNNFKARADAMDVWAKKIIDFGDDNYRHDELGNVMPTPVRQMYVPRLTAKYLRDKLPKNPKMAVQTLVDTINKRNSMTTKQQALTQRTLEDIVSKLSPEEMVEVYNSTMHDPHANTQKVRNALDPLRAIRSHLQMPEKWEDNKPIYKKNHIKAMMDFIDSLPEEKRKNMDLHRDDLEHYFNRGNG